MKKTSRLSPLTKTFCLGGALLGGAMMARADDAADMQALKDRVAQLEGIAVKEGILPSGTPAPKFVSAMSDITISGFVQASYFYNTQRPADGQSDAYLWNTKDNSFSLNKFKLTIASKPLETDKWDAGFRTSLMWGEDAPDLNSSGMNGTNGANIGFDNLREAYVELNVPIGTGLNIKMGELISLLNFESGDGGVVNPNFSQGNQWWFTGNGPSAGIQVGYNFTDKIGLTVRVDNGLFQGPVDVNSGKAFSSSLNLKPFDKAWVNLISWYESASGGTEIYGASAVGGYQFTKKLGTSFELDYFKFNNTGASDMEVWSIGGWAWYDFTDKFMVAVRADYVDNPDAVLGPPVRPGAGIITTDTSGDLASFTLTLNYKLTPAVKIQPEIRYDTTSYSGGLDGEEDRVIIGCGVSYLF